MGLGLFRRSALFSAHSQAMFRSVLLTHFFVRLASAASWRLRLEFLWPRALSWSVVRFGVPPPASVGSPWPVGYVIDLGELKFAAGTDEIGTAV